MKNYGRLPCVLAVCFLCALPAFSDVLFLNTGEVVLGSLESASGGNIAIRSLGQTRSLEAGQIERSEQSLDVLKDIPLEILLKDGTVIRGTIVDYDEEIGVFVDISFGNLALPLSSIERIQDPAKKTREKTDDIVLGLSGLWTFTASEDFGGSAGTSATADFRIKPLRGLYLGADIFWYPLNYTVDDEVRYTLGGMGAHVLYKAFWLENAWNVFGTLVPYAKLGGDAAFVQVIDQRASAPVERQGSLTVMATGQLGFEWNLPSVFWLRFFFNADLALQSGGQFFMPGAGLGLCVSI